MSRRVIVKLSGEALAGTQPGLYDDWVIMRIVSEIKQAVAQGIQVALVVGGGNIWRGRNTENSAAVFPIERSRSDHMGMCATIINAIYLSQAFQSLQISAPVMTPFAMGSFTGLFELRDADARLARGEVVINAGGLGHPYFSTDTITALRGAELHADSILYAKNGVDGVYDDDPRVNAAARLYKSISYWEVIQKNLKVADTSAMHISMEAGTASFIFNMDRPGALYAACTGQTNENVLGTHVSLTSEEEYYV